MKEVGRYPYLDVCTLPLYVEFITGLLNNVGTHIDPTKLIQVIRVWMYLHIA